MEKDIVYYLKKACDGVKSWFDKPAAGQQQALGQQSVQPERQRPFDYVAFREDTFQKMALKVERLVPRWDLYQERVLTIYISDRDIYWTAAARDMATDFNNYINLRSGGRFHEVLLHEGSVDSGVGVATVNDNVKVAVSMRRVVIVPPTPNPVNVVATVSMLYDSSICCILDGPVNLQPQDNRVWNIGWGTNPLIDNVPRSNQIALAYKNLDKEDPNKFMVSRAHAHIKYTGGRYYLFVENRGVKQAGKSTVIERDGNLIRLTSPTVGIPLHNGDVIRLNYEYLLFKCHEQ